MHRQRAQRRLWAWHLSALVYEWSYVQVAHQIDEDCLAFLGERLMGALVADCGCGPGVVAEKLVRAGASLVVAIDSNASMLKRARARLAQDIARGKVLVYHGSYEAETLAGIREQALAGRGFDLVLFKRSLYMPRLRALCTLRTAAASLCTRGLIVVAHPDRSLWRYACAPPFGFTSYTPLHIVNRAVSRVLACGVAVKNTRCIPGQNSLGCCRRRYQGRMCNVCTPNNAPIIWWPCKCPDASDS